MKTQLYHIINVQALITPFTSENGLARQLYLIKVTTREKQFSSHFVYGETAEPLSRPVRQREPILDSLYLYRVT